MLVLLPIHLNVSWPLHALVLRNRHRTVMRGGPDAVAWTTPISARWRDPPHGVGRVPAKGAIGVRGIGSGNVVKIKNSASWLCQHCSSPLVCVGGQHEAEERSMEHDVLSWKRAEAAAMCYTRASGTFRMEGEARCECWQTVFNAPCLDFLRKPLRAAE